MTLAGKACPDCTLTVAPTARKCSCGYDFRSWARNRKTAPPPAIVVAAPVIAPPGKPHVEVFSPGRVSKVPLNTAFLCELTSSGCLVFSWPALNVRFTLTPQEREIVRGALL